MTSFYQKQKRRIRDASEIYNTLGNVRHNRMAARSRKRIIAVADTESPVGGKVV